MKTTVKGPYVSLKLYMSLKLVCRCQTSVKVFISVVIRKKMIFLFFSIGFLLFHAQNHVTCYQVVFASESEPGNRHLFDLNHLRCSQRTKYPHILVRRSYMVNWRGAMSLKGSEISCGPRKFYLSRRQWLGG